MWVRTPAVGSEQRNVGIFSLPLVPTQPLGFTGSAIERALEFVVSNFTPSVFIQKIQHCLVTT